MNVLPRVRMLGEVALDFLFPKSCLGCGREGQFICYKCHRSLPRVIPPVCPRCGKSQAGDAVCPSCVTWKSHIDGIRSPFRFEGVMRQAVHELKYRNLRALAAPLAGLMSDYLTSQQVPGDLLIPVPLHPKRLRERGYNQSELLAREMGKLVSLPVARDTVIRTRGTPPQARTLSLEDRRRNVAGAFSCRGDALRDTRVVLIDDVATSAATLDACAGAIKAAGAASVWGLTLAREL